MDSGPRPPPGPRGPRPCGGEAQGRPGVPTPACTAQAGRQAGPGARPQCGRVQRGPRGGGVQSPGFGCEWNPLREGRFRHKGQQCKGPEAGRAGLVLGPVPAWSRSHPPGRIDPGDCPLHGQGPCSPCPSLSALDPEEPGCGPWYLSSGLALSQRTAVRYSLPWAQGAPSKGRQPPALARSRQQGPGPAAPSSPLNVCGAPPSGRSGRPAPVRTEGGPDPRGPPPADCGGGGAEEAAGA